jgi:two-component system, response regulator YesN
MAYDLVGIFIRVNHHLRTVPGASLEEIAASMKVERHTIEKAVKKATGKTFREVRTRILVEHARDLLDRNPNHTIKEVAFQLGYQSQRSFSRFIKSVVGCSPREFRSTKPQL